MPPPKKVKKLESQRRKGFEVEYPAAPWYTDNVEKIEKEYLDRKDRIKNAENAQYLEHLPAERKPTPDRIRYQREAIYHEFKFPK